MALTYALPILLVLGLAPVALLIVLLSNRKTRAGTLIALAVVPVVVVLVAVTIRVLSYRGGRVSIAHVNRPVVTGSAEYYYDIGNAAAAQGHFDEAIREYRRAIQIKPDDANAYRALGRVLANRDRFDEARAQYQKALELRPDFLDVYIDLAKLEASRGRIADADVYCKTALRLKPDSAAAHECLASVLVRSGRYDEAIAHYQKAQELKPDDSKTRDGLKKALEQQAKAAGKVAAADFAEEGTAVSQTNGATTIAAIASKLDQQTFTAATETGKETAPPENVKEAAQGTETVKDEVAADTNTKKAGDEEAKDARPAWVEADPQLVNDVYQMAIATWPYTTLLECKAKLPEEIRGAINRYAEICIGPEAVGVARVFDADFCQKLVKQRWVEVKQYSVGQMIRLHALLEFDWKVKDRVVDAYKQLVVEKRLWQAGLWLAGVLGVLAALYGYLKITAAGSRERQSALPVGEG